MNDKEYEIEREKIEVEREKLNKSNKFNLNSFGILIASIVSIATIIVSYINSNESTENKKVELAIAQTKVDIAEIETNRRYNLDVAQFLTTNSKIIFNGTIDEQERMKNIMFVSLPSEINEVVFEKISITMKNVESKEMWNNAGILAETQTDNISNQDIDNSISENESIEFYINLLDGNRIERKKASQLLTEKKNQQEVVNALIDNIKNDSEKGAYRKNFYIAFTLYKMQNKWTADKIRVNRIMDLTNSVNYADFHFKKYTDLAIKNMKQ